MKKIKRIMALLLVFVLVLSATACGAPKSSSNFAASSAADSPRESGEISYDAATAEQAVAMDGAPEVNKSAAAPNNILPDSSRKLIRRVYLDVETLDFDNLSAKIEQQIAALGGYIEQSEISGNSYRSESKRYSHIVARIPKAKVDGFIGTVGEIGNITNKQDSVEDVTLQYVDVESRKKSLKIEQERLLVLLAKAEKLEDIIQLEQRLSQVRYELENYESQLRTYDNQVDYSTVTLDIREVQRVTPAEQKTMWSRMKTGFSETILDIKEGCKNFAVWFVVNLPYIVIWAVLITVVVIVLRKVNRLAMGDKPKTKRLTWRKDAETAEKAKNDNNEDK